DNATGNFSTAEVTHTVVQWAVPTQPDVRPLEGCDTDGGKDGVYESIDLTHMCDVVHDGQYAADFTIVFINDADGTQAIANPQSYASATGLVYAAVMNNATGCISNVVSIAVTVESLPTPQITSDTGGNTICVDYATDVLLSGIVLDAGMANPANYTY